MKRMFLLVFTLFSGFFLAGCDLISPEKVEDLSKELCETNPDSELCNIENLNDLEEDVIADLVEKAFLELKSANTDTCADYFSVTNPNLIDECEKAVNNLTKDKEKKWDKEVNSYYDATRQGIEPRSTRQPDIDAAVKLSNEAGKAFDGTKLTFKE